MTEAGVRVKVAFLVTRDGEGAIGIGDCIVITFDDKDDASRQKCIVIDGGYSKTAKVLKSYLDGENITTVDLVIATHIDDDHINGLKAFFADYVDENGPVKVLNYWGPEPKRPEPMTITEFTALLPDANDLGIKELSFISQSVGSNEDLWESAKKSVGEDHIWHPSFEGRDSLPILFKAMKIEILGPDKQVPSLELKSAGAANQTLEKMLLSDAQIDLCDVGLKNKILKAAKENDRTANNQSIVLRLTPYDDAGGEVPVFSFLFTGDAEIESWKTMIQRDKDSLKAEHLKVSHHGSATGTNEDVLDAVTPRYGIICAGKNKHGLPDGAVFKLLQGKGVKIICTGRNPKKGVIPCAEQKYLDKCPRWDKVKDREITDPVVFEFDTRPLPGASIPPVSFCGNDWTSEAKPL
jgi:beta-lactamase superfamily II metal-dependent hydrolase